MYKGVIISDTKISDYELDTIIKGIQIVLAGEQDAVGRWVTVRGHKVFIPNGAGSDFVDK